MAEELRINITVDNTQAAGQFNQTASNASRMADGIRGAGDAIQNGLNPSLGGMIAMLETAAPWLLALTAIITAVTAYGKALSFMVGEAIQAEKVTAQTAAVIKSTGGVAGVSAEMVEDLAGELSNLTGVEDELIQSSENVLLTFTEINKNIFPQVTQTALDLSQAFSMDLQSSTVMLGKALQDPIAGLTALRRVGVSFSEAEQEVIKNMVEHNRVAAAQAFILEAVNKQVAGSAEAMGNTVAGQWAKLTNLFKNRAEEFGKILTPLIEAGLGTLVDVLQEVVKGTEPMLKTLQQAMKELGASFRTPEMRKELRELGKTIGEIFGEMGPSLIRGFVDALAVMAKLVVQFGPQMVQAFIKIAESARIVASAIAGIIDALHQLGIVSAAQRASGGMPGFAGGVSNFSGGLAQVHKDEVMYLPRGSTVLSNREVKEAIGGGGSSGGTFQFNGPVTFAIQGGDRVMLEDLAQQVQMQTMTSGASL